jgi:hypothetical protein
VLGSGSARVRGRVRGGVHPYYSILSFSIKIKEERI